MGDPAHTQTSLGKPGLGAAQNNIKEAGSQGVSKEWFGFPKPDGSSRSHWLHGVEGDELLDHRTTPTLPPWADIVIIGSGVSSSDDEEHTRDGWLKSIPNS